MHFNVGKTLHLARGNRSSIVSWCAQVICGKVSFLKRTSAHCLLTGTFWTLFLRWFAVARPEKSESHITQGKEGPSYLPAGNSGLHSSEQTWRIWNPQRLDSPQQFPPTYTDVLALAVREKCRLDNNTSKLFAILHREAKKEGRKNKITQYKDSKLLSPARWPHACLKCFCAVFTWSFLTHGFQWGQSGKWINKVNIKDLSPAWEAWWFCERWHDQIQHFKAWKCLWKHRLFMQCEFQKRFLYCVLCILCVPGRANSSFSVFLSFTL